VTSECSVVVLAAPSVLTGGEGAGAEGPPPVHNYQYKDTPHRYILWCMKIALKVKKRECPKASCNILIIRQEI
jgi:hypothetical protein